MSVHMDPDRRPIADAAAARRALDLAMPMLLAGLEDDGVGESHCMHIVIMDPSKPYGACEFEAAILLEHSLPSRERWDADYAHYAREKARVTWRTRFDSGQLMDRAPHLLCQGDTVLAGGIVLDGIVVAVSGANGWYDEAFSRCVASLLRAVVRERLHGATQP